MRAVQACVRFAGYVGHPSGAWAQPFEAEVRRLSTGRGAKAVEEAHNAWSPVLDAYFGRRAHPNRRSVHTQIAERAHRDRYP
jgi:hypothetical protein